MKVLVRLLISAGAIFLLSYLGVIPGFGVSGPEAALVAAVVLAVVNLLVRPLVVLFTLPINVVTLGLFGLVINGLMLLLVGYLVQGFHVGGPVGAILGAVALSILTWILNKVFDVGKGKD